jgi:DNA-binding MarR family transcriptional regulator
VAQTLQQQVSAWQALNEAHGYVAARLDFALAEASLPPRTWYQTLAALQEQPSQTLRMGELALAVGITPGGMTKLFDKLEQAGLVERKACPVDRRASHAGLTPAGEQMADQMRPVYTQVLEEHFASLVGDDLDSVAVALGRVTADVTCPSAALEQ